MNDVRESYMSDNCSYCLELVNCWFMSNCFYQISSPTKHPDQRHKERMALRNPRKLYDRKCMCPTCKTPDAPMYTTYAPDRPETVYCEECYQKEVYS